MSDKIGGVDYEEWKQRRMPITFDKTRKKTQESMQKMQNINVIMAQAEKTGRIAPESIRQQLQPLYADISKIGDLADCYRVIADGQMAFASLPANIRNAFDNDPENFLASVSAAQCGDREAKQALQSIGLIDPDPTIPMLTEANSGANPGRPNLDYDEKILNIHGVEGLRRVIRAELEEEYKKQEKKAVKPPSEQDPS